MKELGDRAAQGRAYGNLGNTHYLLGNFTEATTFHKEVSWAWVLGQGYCNRKASGHPHSPQQQGLVVTEPLLLLCLVLWSQSTPLDT